MTPQQHLHRAANVLRDAINHLDETGDIDDERLDYAHELMGRAYELMVNTHTDERYNNE